MMKETGRGMQRNKEEENVEEVGRGDSEGIGRWNKRKQRKRKKRRIGGSISGRWAVNDRERQGGRRCRMTMARGCFHSPNVWIRALANNIFGR